MSTVTDTKNVFVVGLDDFNRKQLEALPEAEDYNIKKALSLEELKCYDKHSIPALLRLSEQRMSGENVDALITWWDFPGTLVLGLLNDTYGFIGPGINEMLQCEHKYWSRLEQRRLVPEVTPSFDVLDPFDPPPFDEIEVEAPFWLKPVKSTDSMLSFKIKNEQGYKEALEEIRREIDHLAKPFNEILERADMPDEIRKIDGRHCLVEASCKGSQHTVDGYIHNGKVHIYGVIDSLHYPDSSSFFCYLNPSRLPETAQETMIECTRLLMGDLALDQSAFNVEYFYDEDTGTIHLLEVNPRISQSHSNIYLKVDGKSNEALIVELAAGEEPTFPAKQGEFNCAAKFYYRRFEDGLVKKVPTEAEIEEIRRDHPNTLIHIEATEGERLSEALQHDSYSYVLAILFLGGDDFDHLMTKYKEVTGRLDFKIEPT